MMIYYVMLRGVDKFQAEYNSYPGEFDDQVEPDIVKLKVSIFLYMYNYHRYNCSAIGLYYRHASRNC